MTACLRVSHADREMESVVCYSWISTFDQFVNRWTITWSAELKTGWVCANSRSGLISQRAQLKSRSVHVLDSLVLMVLQKLVKRSCKTLASFPGLPRFLFFGFRQYNTWKRKSVKNGEGLGTPITWMMSGGREVDVGGGRGPRSNNVLDFIIECSNDSQDSWGSQDRQYSTSLVRNSLYCLLHTSWLMGNAPLHPLHVQQTSFTW